MSTADRAAPPLTLGDLIAEESFGLELLSGGPEAAERAVAGAHAVEVEAPTRWLAKDWVMLTTGVRLRGSTATQRALVGELEEAGVSALGFGVGLVFERPPAALLHAARERAYPVFAVPYETPFREIVRFVDASLAAGELGAFRRLTSLQRYLIDALNTPEPEQEIVARLARFLDGAVLVFGADGQLEIRVGKAPAADLWPHVREHPSGLLEIELSGWQAVAMPVPGPAGPEQRWLVVAGRGQDFVDKLVKAAAQSTAPLLAAVGGLGNLARDQEQAVKGALLEESLQPVEAQDLPLAARAAAFGVDFSDPARMLVLRRDGEPGPPPVDFAGLSRDLVRRLKQAGIPHLVATRADSLAALVQGSGGDLRAALAGLAEAQPAAVIGVGRPIRAIADAHDSLRDAEIAVDRARRQPGRQAYFEELDLGAFVVSEIGPERIAPKLEDVLAPVRANPQLHEALSAWFEHDLDVVAAARALHLHPNSLRYRLARLEAMLGGPLRRPATIAALYLALTADAGTRRSE